MDSQPDESPSEVERYFGVGKDGSSTVKLVVVVRDGFWTNEEFKLMQIARRLKVEDSHRRRFIGKVSCHLRNTLARFALFYIRGTIRAVYVIYRSPSHRSGSVYRSWDIRTYGSIVRDFCSTVISTVRDQDTFEVVQSIDKAKYY